VLAKRVMRGAAGLCAPRAALALVLALGCASAAIAEDKPASLDLRVAVSIKGRTIFDSLIEAMTAHTGLAGQLTVSYADSLVALRNFCRNGRGTSPDIVLAVHRMQPALAAECAVNGAEDIAEVELGRSALILAVRTGSLLSSLTSRQVYLAIAREVPYRDAFVRNTAVRWSDVDRSLPTEDIRFQLPMRDEGSRAIFDSLVLEGGCRNETVVKQIFDAQQRSSRCTTARTDRLREVPRAQATRMLLEAPLGTVGVLSQVDLAQSNGQFVGLPLDGVAPSPDAILSATYGYSTSFWLYAKRGRTTPGRSGAIDAAVEHIIDQAQSEAVIGPNGPLESLGLVPLPPDERVAQRAALAATGVNFGVGSMMGWVTSIASDAWNMFGVRSSIPPDDAGAPATFTSLMDIAGYRVTEINSSIGILPDAGMAFGIAREMSDSDQTFLERSLYRDSFRRPGALSAMQRKIVRSIMDVREVGSFEVSKVEIVFLPLPKVALVVSPKDVIRAAGQQTGSGDGE
jgi:phosphate transport system substrate-binding protein